MCHRKDAKHFQTAGTLVSGYSAAIVAHRLLTAELSIDVDLEKASRVGKG